MTHNRTTSPPRATASFPERRAFGRYHLPVSLLVEARWKGRALRLDPCPQHENISAGGLTVCVAEEPAPPVNAILDILLRLVERPFQTGRVYARCRGRVLRCDAPGRLAVHFEQVSFVQPDKTSREPVPAPTPAGRT